jgi:beta-lactamase regulating signal transducer with metallopeptidase domain
MLESTLPTASSLAQWWVAACLWTGAVYIVVRAVDGATAKVLGPRARMALYSLVLVRLVLPPAWSSPLGLVDRGGDAQATEAAVDADATATAAALGAAQAEITIPWLSRQAGVEAPPTDAEAAGSSWPLLLLYGAGVAAAAVVARRRRRALTAIVAASRPAPRELAALGGDARVVIHAHAGPMVFGLQRPTIVLPAAVAARSKAQTALVLAHERAHVDGGDLWLTAGLSAVTALAWPVVPVWLAAARVRTLVEQAADARALTSASGAERRRYGRLLLAMVSDAPRPAIGLGLGLGSYGDLRSRVQALVAPPRTSRFGQVTLTAALGAGVVACAGVGPQADSAEACDEEPTVRAADCDALAEAAMSAHDAATRGEAPNTAALAAYDRYLDACADDPQRPKMVYYAGEARWAHATALHRGGDEAAAQEEFAAARGLFEAAAEVDGDHREDAAYASHMSTKNALGWEPAADAPECENCAARGFPKLPYTAAEEDVLRSWDRFADRVGRPLVVGADEQLAIARLRMQHNDFAAARPDLEELVDRVPGSEEGLRAAEMLVDLLTIAWTSAPAEAKAAPSDELRAALVGLRGSKHLEVEGSERLAAAVSTLLQALEAPPSR